MVRFDDDSLDKEIKSEVKRVSFGFRDATLRFWVSLLSAELFFPLFFVAMAMMSVLLSQVEQLLRNKRRFFTMKRFRETKSVWFSGEVDLNVHEIWSFIAIN